MSDPATNPQIEDVLSSIRRLVAEEIGQTPLAARKQATAEPDKLVLSPTQKIRAEVAASGADLWDDTAEMAPAQPEKPWWARSDKDPVIPRDTAEEAPQPLVAEGDAPFVSDAEEQAADTQAAAPQPKSRLQGALAELEAALSRQDTEFEPPEGEDARHGGLEMTAMPWSEEPLTFAEEEPAEAASEPAEDVEAVAPAAPEAESAEAEAPEAEVQTFAEQEEEDAEDAPFSFDPHERLFDRAAAEATFRHHPYDDDAEEELEQEDRLDAEPAFSEADYDEPVPGLTGEIDPADLIDEQALRDLVADIVRQELQGALGERITRNVRKLVRREIHRALMGLDQSG